MTREEWEDVLYAAVPDEVVQDQLNDYVLSLEWEVAKLRELVRDLWAEMYCPAEVCPSCAFNVDDECVFETRIRKLGIKGIEV